MISTMEELSYFTLSTFIAVLSLSPAAATTIARQCSDKSSRWRDLGGDFCYIIEKNERMPWIDAVYTCFNEGGSLASFHSSDEVLKVIDETNNEAMGLHIGLWKHYDGSLEWVDKSAIDFRNWNRGEPNFSYEQCVEFYSSSGKWNDISCTAERGYICSSPKLASSQLNLESRKICTDTSDNWRDFGGELCYIVESERKTTWNNALQHCTAQGGTLASFYSLEEISAVLQRTRNIEAWFHIGLRQNDNGLFKWADGSRVDLDFWKSGLPNNDEKLCGQMNTQSGHWSEADCEKISGYICSSAKEVCGRDIHSVGGTLHSPLFPRNYRENEDCTWHITVPEGYRVALTFHWFALEDDHQCHLDYVKILDGHESNSAILGTFCGTRSIGFIHSSRNKMALHFVTDEEQEERGFQAEFVAVPDCDEDIIADHGVIESPRIRNNMYGPGQKCMWRITAPANHRVLLKFLSFDIQGLAHCKADAVQVLDGHNSSSPVLGTFCGSDIPESIRSSGNEMSVVFTSDLYIEKPGFSAEFQTDICGGYFFSVRGVISSPNYPGSYRANESCIWKISVPENYTVALQFYSFELEDSGCNFDFVEIRDGHETNSPLLGKFCGKDVPDIIRSSTNNVTVKFISDYTYQGSGFTATFIKAKFCEDKKLVAENGDVQSPNYPEDYGAGAECFWNIKVPSNQKISLKFVNFEVEDSDNCTADFLEIYDGTESSALLSTTCGSTLPDEVISTGNEMTLAFSSDLSVEKKGFHAHFKGVCGEDFFSESGTFSTPNYPQKYGKNQECFWRITVPENNHVVLQFQSFKVENSDNCSYDYVKIYDGHDSNSILLGVLCSEYIPSAIRSTQNKMSVKFLSDDLVEKQGFSATFTTEMSTAERLKYAVHQLPYLFVKEYVPSVKKNIRRRLWRN